MHVHALVLKWQKVFKIRQKQSEVVDFAVATAEREDIDEATARHVVVAGVRCSATLISGARALVNVVCKQKHNYVHDCNSVLQMDISFYCNGVGGVYTEKAHDACSSFRI